MKILFLTDSLSLPRKNNDHDKVTYEETYLNKLRAFFSEDLIVDCAIGGARITELDKQCFYYKVFEPDIVFLQSGIVDCCPRPYGVFTSKVISAIGLQGKLSKIKKFLRKNRNYTYTDKKQYEHSLLKIKKSFPNAIFVSLGIINGVEAYEKLVPGIKKNINAYNAILKKNSNYIDTSIVGEEDIMDDYHHLNKQGHHKLYLLIKNEIEKQNDSN